MRHTRCRSLFLVLALLIPGPMVAQDDTEEGDENGGRPALDASLLSSLELRSIGPALTSGRIGDLAVHADDPATWYVAVSSGGV